MCRWMFFIYIYIISKYIYPYKNKTQNDVSCTHVVACSWAILVRKKVAGTVILQQTVDSHGDPHASLWTHPYICMYIYVHLKRWRSCASNNVYFNIQCMRSIYNTVNPSYHTSKNKNPCICRYAICKSTCINKNMHVHIYIYIIYYIYIYCSILYMVIRYIWWWLCAYIWWLCIRKLMHYIHTMHHIYIYIMHMEPDPARHETVQTGINGPHNNFWTRFPMINHFHLEQCLATKQGCRYVTISPFPFP